jgi:voltage-gated potassium channel Kch/Trk K+ transport system NAD-binding subunit
MESARRSRSRSAVSAVDGRPSIHQRLRYAFDNTMARGTPALIGWLALVTLGLIAVFTAIVLVADIAPDDSTRTGTVGQAFDSLLHALDPGTIAGDDGHWTFLLVMLLVTLGGLFVVSALIGVIATGLDTRIDEMRKGRSVVLEEDHTLILGWSDTVFTVLAELEIANQSRKRPSAVVLADRDKVEMDDLIRDKVHPTRTRVVTRTGSPIDLGDLARVRPEKARSIVVLSPEGDEEPDAQVIKVVLALTKGRGHRGRRDHIVAEIHDPANLSAAGLVSGDEAVLIDKRETIAKLVVHSARQSGASVAFIELLDFEGDEIYFREDPALVGRPFGEAMLAYEECSVIGLIDADGVTLNPAAEREIRAGERLIAIAGDDTHLMAAKPRIGEVEEEAIADAPPARRSPERILVLGWNDGAPAVINQFDQFLLEGSELLLVTEAEGANACVERNCAEVSNTRIELRAGNIADRGTLEAIGVESFDHVIVLTPEGLDAQRADARTLVTLLHLRDIADQHGADFSIVSEMIDERNRELAEVTRVDDVIVSDKILSLMLTQISETRELAEVFDELFAAEGSEIYLRPAGDYLVGDRETSYATVVEAAMRRGECAIGYRETVGADDPDSDFGVRINPPKSARVTLGGDDQVIVLAED